MAFFGDAFLDQIRGALSVRAVVEKHHKLRKKSGQEYVAIDDNSLTVNDGKNLWHDFSKGKGGDIFAFEQWVSGCTFEQAVERLARDAGIQLPKRPGANRASAQAGGDPRGEPPPPDGSTNGSAQPRSGAKQITATYDYRDPDGGLRYQVVRSEWFEGGKKKKTFFQRRPAPGGFWVWGLADGEFLKGNDGNWFAATEERVARSPNAQRQHFEGEAHRLYRMPELREELSQDESEQQIVFMPEGEKDCDTLVAWGLVATTNSGGVSNWRPEHAEELRGADVVILLDNDLPGRERGQTIARSLRGISRRTRMLDWRQFWKDVPDKSDVTDWRDFGGGNAEKLFAIVDTLKDWTPAPPETTLGALRFVDLDKPRRRLEWLVKGIMQRGEMSVWFGDWGTGKSFLLTDAGFSIARGVNWFGQRTRPGLVVYQTGEGGIGFGNRMEAYRKNQQLRADDDIAFVALRERVNLFNGEADLAKLLAEVKAWGAYYDMPLELVVIDTFSAATAGADENSGRDVGPILERCRRISVETGAHVAVVHHVPKSGTGPRGWSGFLGNVDSAVLVETLEAKHHDDDDGSSPLPLHSFTIVKQKDAQSHLSRQFVLPQIMLGKDGDGDEITSCTVREVGNRLLSSHSRAVPKGWYAPSESAETLLRGLMRAIKKHGRPAPPGLQAPIGAVCVTVGEWQAEEAERLLGHQDKTATLQNTIRKRIERACERFGKDKANVIGKAKEFVWRTERRIYGIDDLPRPKPEAAPLLAQGESPDDLKHILPD